MHHCGNKQNAITNMHKIHSIIRGIIEYYQVATFVNPALRKYAKVIRTMAFCALRRFDVDWITANQRKNLNSIHKTTAVLYRQ
jgi:hypothetical protein